MVDFRSGYVPPGVYVSADSNAVASAVGVTPTGVCLVGPGLGYQTYSEQVQFSTGLPTVTLTQFGIQQASVVVSLTSGGTTTVYVKDTGTTFDYAQATTHASLPDAVTTLTWESTGNIPQGTLVTVTYNYTNASYFALNQFSDFQTFVDVYGTPLDPATGVVTSPISLAAQVAFENGANNLYAVALNGGVSASSYNAAYALTSNSYDINVIVPVYPTGSIADDSAHAAYAAGLSAHLTGAETDGFPRVAITGVPETFASTVLPTTVAQQFDYKRVMLVWPNQILFYNTALNTSQVIGGSYLAAACAGLCANLPLNQGLTRQQVHSFTGLSPAAIATETTTSKNSWSAGGVAVAEINRTNQMVIRHGVTTDTSSVITREFSIVRCQDALFTTVQETLEQAQLIGTPITSTTALSVKAILTGALETALGIGIIQNYANLTVRQQSLPSGDPTVIECVFSYQPTYPLNYITVSMTLDLSTGQLTDTTDTAGSAAVASA